MAKPTTPNTPAKPFDLKTAALAARKEKKEKQSQAAVEKAQRHAEEDREYVFAARAAWLVKLPADFFDALGKPERPVDTEVGDADLRFHVAGRHFVLSPHGSDFARIEWGASDVVAPYDQLQTALLELIGEWLEEEDELGQPPAADVARYFWLGEDADSFALFVNHGNIARSLATIDDVERWLNEFIAPVIEAAEEVQLAGNDGLTPALGVLYARLDDLNRQ